MLYPSIVRAEEIPSAQPEPAAVPVRFVQDEDCGGKRPSEHAALARLRHRR